VDRNGDGFVDEKDLVSITAFPDLDAYNGGTLTSAAVQDRVDDADQSTNKPGVRTDVIFYSPGKGTSSGGIRASDAVWSW
jgi:hypothetical protein